MKPDLSVGTFDVLLAPEMVNGLAMPLTKQRHTGRFAIEDGTLYVYDEGWFVAVYARGYWQRVVRVQEETP